MDKKEVYFDLIKKIEKYTDSPYFDRESVQKVTAAFDTFVNSFDIAKMEKAAKELADDEYAKEFMKEQGLTFPQTTDEALDRGLDVMAEKITRTHRTLQQNFMRMLITFIKIQATAYDAGIYDLRNEATCRQSKIMWEALCDKDDIGLPYV